MLDILNARMGSMRNKLRASLRDVRIPAAIISFFLSAWSVFLDNVVNNDGILYVRTATLFVHGEWDAAFDLYKWPFYSLLIAITSQITGLSLEYSAHLLNSVLTAMTVVCFISLIHEVGGVKKTVLAAAFVVLLYPGINEYRSFIGRDAGYIAFYLLSLLLFFKYANSPRFGYAIGWASSIFIAALFRIEGFLFLLILPLLYQWRKVTTLPARLMLVITMIGACLVSGLIMTWWFFGITLGLGADKILHAAALSYQSLWQYISAHVSAKTLVIGEQFLNKYSREHAFAAYIAAMGAILLAEVFARLTPLYAFLTGHAVYRKLIFPVDGIKYFWTWLVFLNLAILGVFVVVMLFLTGRFPLALCLTLMLAVPFSLIALYEKWQENRAKPIRTNWIFPTVVILFLLMAVDGLYSPTSKNHIKEAGVWIRENTPPQSTLLSNNHILTFYSGKDVSTSRTVYHRGQAVELIRTEKWVGYDYLAFRIRREHSNDEASLINTLGKDPIVRFVNRKGDKVVIFKVH